MKTIVCIGDSIVEGEGDELNLGGWPGRLAAKLGPHRFDTNGARVFNLGIGGDTIKDVDTRLGELLVRNPDIVILGCGANDLMGTDEQALYTLARYQEIWSKVLGKIASITPQIIVLFGFFSKTEAYEANWRAPYGDIYENHEKTVMEICRKLKVPYIQLGKEFAAADLLCDGLHPNAQGYTLMANAIHQKLTQLQWI